MSLLKVARLGHPCIRSLAQDVSREELSTAACQQLIDDMIQTMRDLDGVGIAAPQVHVSKRIIVIEVNSKNPRYPGRPEVPLTVIINPLITKHSAEASDGWEGCLSVAELRGKVPRWNTLTCQGQDRKGK